MQIDLNQQYPKEQCAQAKKIWAKPSIEIISKNNIQSGFVANGTEGQLTASWTTPTFNDKYHS